jgi:hypothetical protein
MADTSASGKPARGRGRAKAGASDEPTEPGEPGEATEPTAPAGSDSATEPAAASGAGEATVPPDEAGTTPPVSASRRRWSVPFLLFVLVLLAAIAGWAFGVVSYRDKQDAEDQLDELQQSDASTTTELEERIAELDARLEELETLPSRADEMLDDLRTRIDDCSAETAALIELFQNALSGDDVDEDAFDEQAGRTQRVCAEILDGVGSSPDDDTPSTPSTTTLPG